MHPSPLPRFRRTTGLRTLALAVLTVALAACGSGGGEKAHENTVLDTSGRLAIAEQGSAVLRVFDLDAGAVEATRTLDNAPSALYASPGRRYVVAVQRAQDQVQFVDGGIWQEDHGDHLHDYKEPSRLLAWKLTGPQPTHYDVQWGRQAAFFMDGRPTATPPQNSSVQLLTDASIALGASTARLDLAYAVHGLAEPKDDLLLVAFREADAADALPTHLQLYRRAGATYNLDRKLDSRCNGMHGSGSSGAFVVVGCLDGVLVVGHGSTVSDRRITTATRVGTIAAHPAADGHVIGYGNAGTPSTTRFYGIDAREGTAREVVPDGWLSGTVVRGQAFERRGQRWFVIDSLGNLTVLARGASGWSTVHRAASLLPAMPSAAPFPQVAANGARDEIYVTDPIARQLIVLDALTFAVKSRRDLGYVPSLLAWVGIAR